MNLFSGPVGIGGAQPLQYHLGGGGGGGGGLETPQPPPSATTGLPYQVNGVPGKEHWK